MIFDRVPPEKPERSGFRESLKVSSETLRNFSTALMIVGGGFWALYEYSALLEQERAIATVQLNKVKADEIRAKLVPKLSLYIKERFLLVPGPK